MALSLPRFLKRAFSRQKDHGGLHTPDGARVVELPFGPAQKLLGLGGTWFDYDSLYRKQPAVATVVKFLARNIAQLNAKVYEKVPDGRLPRNDHELQALLRHPNPRMSRYRFQFATVADVAIWDKAYWLKMRQNGQVRALVRLPPSKVWEEWDYETGQYVLRAWDRRFRRDDVVVFGGYDPGSNDQSVSPLEQLRQVLEEDWLRQIYSQGYWKNSARQSTVVERPLDAPEWSDEAFERFKESWKEQYSGAANAGGTAILEEGMKLKELSFNMRESQYVESRKLTLQEVAQVYGIPPTMVGILDKATFSNIEQQHIHVYQDVLGPFLRYLQDEIELQLLPEFEPFDSQKRVYLEFNIHEKLKGSFEEETKSLIRITGRPVMTAKEARDRLNLPPLDDPTLDEVAIPLNLILGGQPSPVTPTSDPGEELGAAAAGGFVLPSQLPYLLPYLLGQKQQAEPEREDPVEKAAAEERAAHDKFLDEGRARYEQRALEIYVRTFDRQKNVMASGGEFRRDRWDRELADDLYGLGIQAAEYFGEDAAERIGGKFDAGRTTEYLKETAARMSEEINGATAEQIAAADDPAEALEEMKGGRAKDLAVLTTTRLVNWSVLEAARQNE